MAVVTARDDVCTLFYRFESIRDRNGAFAEPEKGIVVFGIPESDDVMDGKTKFVECGLKSCTLVRSRGQNHHRAFIEGHVQVQAQVLDRLQNCTLVWLPSGYAGFPDSHRRDPSPLELVNQFFRSWR